MKQIIRRYYLQILTTLIFSMIIGGTIFREQVSHGLDMVLDLRGSAASSGQVLRISGSVPQYVDGVFSALTTQGDMVFRWTDTTTLNRLAIGTQGGTIQLWDVTTGTLINTINGSQNNNYVASLIYSPDGQVIAAGMKDPRMPIGALTSTIWLWDVKTGMLLNAIEGYQANIVYLSFSPDGALLATASSDGTMRLWGVPPA